MQTVHRQPNASERYGKDFVELFEKSELQSPLRQPHLLNNVDVTKDSVVADFGCGTGRLLPFIKDKVRYYYGIDFSQACIDAAVERLRKLGATNAEFVCEAIPDFCSRHPAAFDAGFAFDIAEHIHDDDCVAILAAIRQSLKPEGKLYIHTPNADFFLEKMKKRNFIIRQLPVHVAVRNAHDHARLLTSAGFSKTSTAFLPHYNGIRLLHPFSVLPLLGAYFKARLIIIAEP